MLFCKYIICLHACTNQINGKNTYPHRPSKRLRMFVRTKGLEEVYRYPQLSSRPVGFAFRGLPLALAGRTRRRGRRHTQLAFQISAAIINNDSAINNLIVAPFGCCQTWLREQCENGCARAGRGEGSGRLCFGAISRLDAPLTGLGWNGMRGKYNDAIFSHFYHCDAAINHNVKEKNKFIVTD